MGGGHEASLDGSFERRVVELTAASWSILAARPETSDIAVARQTVADLTGLISELSGALVGDEAGEVRELLGAVVAVQRELRAHARSIEPMVRRSIESALTDLARAVSARELIASAPAGMCRACGFDRALLSRVRGSTWVPDNLHVQVGAVHPGNVALAEFIRDAKIPLAASALEAEMVRRRSPALVSDTSGDKVTYPPIVEQSETTSYVAVPVVIGDVVVGIFHADRLSSGRPLSIEDRDNAQAYADGAAVLFEEAIARERLHGVAAELSDTLTRADATLQAQAVPPEQLESPNDLPVAAATGIAALTRREREILGLIALGATNALVAERLVISESTVKSHVRNVMRKLGTRSRTTCVAIYYAHERRNP